MENYCPKNSPDFAKEIERLERMGEGIKTYCFHVCKSYC